jgi:uncharacterized membrane protein
MLESGPRRQGLGRWWRHLGTGTWAVRRRFDDAALARIQEAIRQSEVRHRGEIRFAVEACLTPLELLAGLQPRDRAWQLFSEHRLWDTEHNNGVLIYLLWADRAVEIIADRGAHRAVDPQVWPEACAALSRRLREDAGVVGVIEAVGLIGEALARRYPLSDPSLPDADELSNAPIVLR